MEHKQFYVYIMSNRRNTVLYAGVMDNLVQRVWTYKNKVDAQSFTSKYNLHKLVYYEIYEDAYTAISREKQLKGGPRRKKLELVEVFNPTWKDLSEDIT